MHLHLYEPYLAESLKDSFLLILHTKRDNTRILGEPNICEVGSMTQIPLHNKSVQTLSPFANIYFFQ
jgi:hypothetical protein